ncbi:MAG: ectoine hydroxylase [Actinomycetota bacterium]
MPNFATTLEDRYPSRLESTSRLIERRDPVVYGRNPGPLNEEQIQSFSRDGFIQMRGVLGPSEVEAVHRELGEMIARPQVRRDKRTIVEQSGNEVRSIFQVHQTSRLIARLAADERIAGTARQILGSDVYLHQSRVNFKPAFEGNDFSWHSDFETWHTEDGMPAIRAVSFSISLTENRSYNGPLLLIPGSHRIYVTCVGETPEDNYRSSLQFQRLGVPEKEHLRTLYQKAGRRIEVCTGEPGDMTVFDCNTMHASPSNVSPLPRSNVFLVYNSVENLPVEPFAAPERRPDYLAGRDFTPI